MKHYFRLFIFVLFPFFLTSEVRVGVGCSNITPPIGTPSAGYIDRQGKGMEGVHDPLKAIALFIDNGTKQIVLCSVDHLGFSYEMVQNIIHKVKLKSQLPHCEYFIASSHTHSGGGSYLNIPVLGEMLAGLFDAKIAAYYENKTVKAILKAQELPIPAKIGIGYGEGPSIIKYRSSFPKDVQPLLDVAIIKITKLDDSPIAVLFNFPIHPTVLKATNLLFSADCIGCARMHIQRLLGAEMLFFNGAQGDITPIDIQGTDDFKACDIMGEAIGKAVKKIWEQTPVDESFEIDAKKLTYSFNPQATPNGFKLSIKNYASEMNLLVLNRKYAFLTMPGELSCIYDHRLKAFGKKLGYEQVSIFGLVNDAHGYIILPLSWHNKTAESNLSFGGALYGQEMEARAKNLLMTQILSMPVPVPVR